MKCKCTDRAHPFGTALWHRAYRAWYAHDLAGHSKRAAAWGWAADRIVRWA